MKICAIRMECYSMINYVYIVIDETSRTAIVIDPAWNMNRVMEELERYQVKLSAILLTHSHYDHVNLANRLTTVTGAAVYMSEDEIMTSSFACPNLNAVNDGDVIVVDGIRIKCLLTAGHTKGSMCFLIEDALFTGDTIFIEGCGICEKRSDARAMYNSIQRVKQEINESTRVYPGHCYQRMYGCTMKELKRVNIYFCLTDIDDFIMYRMRGGQKNLYRFI